MNHISNMRWGTLCGLPNNDLPSGDRSLAALIKETQDQVNCQECRNKLGLEPIS